MVALVLAEHDNKVLKSATANAVTAAAAMASDVQVLVAGFRCDPVAAEASALSGVSKVLVADDPAYADWTAENVANLVARVGSEYRHLVAAATAVGKNVMPRVAALLDVAQVSDIVSVEAPDRFVRPIYAGNALETLESSDRVKVVTVRISAFNATVKGVQRATVEQVAALPDASLARVVERALTVLTRPELTAAQVIVSGGRGLQSAENFALLEALADKLGAALGASRAAVDAGYAPNDFQVGQTGKIVAPDLYIAVGISGAIQHLAGMKESKVIVAINKDADAPIFQIADYGLVADLFQAIPELTAALATR